MEKEHTSVFGRIFYVATTCYVKIVFRLLLTIRGCIGEANKQYVIFQYAQLFLKCYQYDRKSDPISVHGYQYLITNSFYSWYFKEVINLPSNFLEREGKLRIITEIFYKCRRRNNKITNRIVIATYFFFIISNTNFAQNHHFNEIIYLWFKILNNNTQYCSITVEIINQLSSSVSGDFFQIKLYLTTFSKKSTNRGTSIKIFSNRWYRTIYSECSWTNSNSIIARFC